jgi:hypothetical protein
LHWDTPPIRGDYPHACHVARSGQREFWVRERTAPTDHPYRQLVFVRGFLVQATNRPDLGSAHAK